MNDPKIRIFVSSPADVEHERGIVKDVIARLEAQYLPYFRIQAVLWEEEALTADRTFQAGLTRPRDCDIVLVILWTRLGTPLPEDPYRGMTGTEWEFVDAVEARVAGEGGPEVLVYRKRAPKLVDINDAAAAAEAVEDRRRLDAFFQRHFFHPDGSFSRAFRVFDSDAVFAELVETQLRKLLNRRISAERLAAAKSEAWQGSPFRPERPFDIQDERVFTGREGEIRALFAMLPKALQAQAGLLLISGASGCGKTSLVRAGVLSKLDLAHRVHGFGAFRHCLVSADGADFVAELARAVCREDVLGRSLEDMGVRTEHLEELLRERPRLGVAQVEAALSALGREIEGGAARIALALVVDPFDALVGSRDEVAPLLRALCATEGVAVLAPTRDAVLPALLRRRALAELVDELTWMRLDFPPPARVRQVIEIPMRIAGIALSAEPAAGGVTLIDRIEAEASRIEAWPGPLQLLLDKLQRADDADLAWGELGGLSGVLVERALAVWSDASQDVRAALPRLCRALLSATGEARRQVSLRSGDLTILAADPSARELVGALTEARLLVSAVRRESELEHRCPSTDPSLLRYLWRTLRTSGGAWVLRVIARAARRRPSADECDPEPSEPVSEGDMVNPAPGASATVDAVGLKARVSLVHELLTEQFEPIGSWLADAANRRDLATRERIGRQAAQWKRTDCNREYLLGESGYAEALAYRERFGDELEEHELELIDDSARLLRFRRSFALAVRGLGLLLSALVLMTGSAAWYAWKASVEAGDNLGQSRLNEAELAIERGNTPRSIALSLSAAGEHPQRAVQVLSRAFNANRLVAMAQPARAPSGVRGVTPALRSDGERVATLLPGRGVVLWRRSGDGYERIAELGGAALGIHRLLFAGKGSAARLLGVTEDALWELRDGVEPLKLFACGGAPGEPVGVDTAGQRLALVSSVAAGQELCLVDLERPDEPVARRLLHKAAVRDLQFSSDGSRLISAAANGVAKLVDTRDGSDLLTLPLEGPVKRPFNAAVFDQDGSRIAIAAADERVRVFDMDGTLLHKLGGASAAAGDVHRSAVRAIAFCPRGDCLVASDDEGQVVRWDLGDEPSASVLGYHGLSVDVVRVATGSDADAEPVVLSASLDRTARLWSLRTGRPLATMSHDAAVTSAQFSSIPGLVLTASAVDGSARVWSVDVSSNLAYRLDSDDHVWDVAIAPAPRTIDTDGRGLLVANASFGGGVRVWYYDRGSPGVAPVELRPLAGHQGRARRVRFSASGRLLASSGYDGRVLISEMGLDGGCELKVGTPKTKVERVLFSPDERLLLSASSDHQVPVRLWDLVRCEQAPGDQELAPPGAGVRALGLMATDGGLLVASGNDEGRVRVTRLDDAGAPTRLCDLQLHSGAITDLALAPDGRHLASAGADGRGLIVELGSCRQRAELLGHEAQLYSIRFAPDGKRLVTASQDKTARIWSLDGQALATLSGHADRVYGAEIGGPGQAWILTASRDGTAALWPLPPPGQERDQSAPFLPLEAALGGVPAAVFSPDGRYVVAGYWENASQLWRVWSEDVGDRPRLERIWGPQRAALALVHEAERWRTRVKDLLRRR